MKHSGLCELHTNGSVRTTCPVAAIKSLQALRAAEMKFRAVTKM